MGSASCFSGDCGRCWPPSSAGFGISASSLRLSPPAGRSGRVRQVGDEELFRFQVAGSVRLAEDPVRAGGAFQPGHRRGGTGLPGRANRPRLDQAHRHPGGAVGSRGGRCHPRDLVRRYSGRRIQPASGRQSERSRGVLRRRLARIGSRSFRRRAAHCRIGIASQPAGRGAARDRSHSADRGLGGGGLAGTIRLARRAGASSGAGHVAAWVYIAGATSSALFGAGQWPLLLAAGALPWALDAVLAPAVEIGVVVLADTPAGGFDGRFGGRHVSPGSCPGSGRRDSLGRLHPSLVRGRNRIGDHGSGAWASWPHSWPRAICGPC